MNDEQAPLEISLGMTADEAWEFLRKAAQDDAFRSKLERDPGGTLAEHGVTVSEQALASMTTVTLPDMTQIEALARIVAPEAEYGADGWCTGGQFITCLWLAIGFAAAHRAREAGPAAAP